MVAEEYQKILVEQSVKGDLIRFFYVRPAVVAVKLSRPASVVGNGVSTLAELIDAKNRYRIQRAVPGHEQILIDASLLEFLTLSARTLDDVPAAAERVFLRATSNGATGADSIAYDDRLHPSYRRLIQDACNAVAGLNVSAVDVVIENPAVPATGNNYWILELNRNPGLTPYHFPWKGRGQDVSGAILDFLGRYDPPNQRKVIV